MIRAVLGTGGKPPLKTPGLEIHDKLARLDDTVAEALKRHNSPLTEQLRKHLVEFGTFPAPTNAWNGGFGGVPDFPHLIHPQ